MKKYLIINADDFGMSVIFNKVILDLLKNEYLRSTTVMVNRITESQEGQIRALIDLKKDMNISVGLHIEFTDTNYPEQIEEQYSRFFSIFDFYPSHADVHKASSFQDALQSVADFCIEKNIPMRNRGVESEKAITTTSEAFFGSIDDFEAIETWIKTRADNTYSEILFHPGTYDPDCTSSLNKERERDVEYIHILHDLLPKYDIELISYYDLVKKYS